MKLFSKVKEIEVEKLIPYVNNPKEHPENQIDKIASSIKNFGFTVPIIVDGANEVIAGHGRLMAAKKLGLTKVPCIVRDDLTEAQVRAFRIADNKVAESSWDYELLAVELETFELEELELTGFDKEELSKILGNNEREDREHPDLSDEIQETFEVIIECEDELSQQEIFNKLTGEGYKCRVLTL